MKFLDTVQHWLIRGVVFLLPLTFLPLTSDFFEFNKMMLLVFGALAAFLLWALSQIRQDFKFRITPFDLPVLALAATFLVSTFVSTPNKYDAFLFPGTTSIVLGATILYFLVVQYLRNKEESQFFGLESLLLLSGGLAGLVSALAGIGALEMLREPLGLPAWAVQKTFSLMGGLLPAIALFVTLLPLALLKVLRERARGTVFNVLALLLIAAGLTVSLYNALPGKSTSPVVLPVSTGWSIALETLKKEPLFGVGPGNFVEAFNRFRPVEFNSSNVWNLRFVVSSNWFFHTWTIAGTLGFLSLIWIVLQVIKNAKREVLTPANYALLASIVVLVLVPANVVILTLFYVLLAIFAYRFGHDIGFQFAAYEGTQAHAMRGINLLAGIFGFAAAALLLVTGYYGLRAYAAEISFKKGLDAVARNDGRATYNELVKTIQTNPQIERYRLSFSQANLALANAIAAKQDLSDQDRQTVSQLIQQSIREGQAAVALNRSRSQNWENLARIYQALFQLAKGADQFAIATYQQAIALDPVNPLLRINLGGVYYALNKYDEAIKTFELAVAAKPDLANAHYNLAVALKAKGETARAVEEMRQTLVLVQPGSRDYETAKAEFDALSKKLAEEATPSAGAQASNTPQTPLEAPAPAPQPVLNPPVDLPQDAAPPAPAEEVNPSPQPQQ